MNTRIFTGRASVCILLAAVLAAGNASVALATSSITRVATGVDIALLDFDGNTMVWRDYDKGVITYDVASRQTRQLGDFANDVAVDGENIVWSDETQGEWGSTTVFHFYNTTTSSETTLNADDWNKSGFALSGNSLAVSDYSNGGSDGNIVVYDLASHTSRQLTTEESRQDLPSIDGTLVSWIDEADDYKYDVAAMDMTTGVKRKITENGSSSWYPRVTAGYVVWPSISPSGVGVYEWATGVKRFYPTKSVPALLSADDGRVLFSDGSGLYRLMDVATLASKAILAEPNGNARLNGTRVAWSSDAASSYSITWLAPNPDLYWADTSSLSAMRPSTPVASSVMKRGKGYTVHGTLAPRHAAGSKPVRVYKYLKHNDGWWENKGYATATVSNSGSMSKYSVKMSLPTRGSWRLRAYHMPDSSHASAWSKSWDTVTVK